jgi:FAD/FMN-containing dehydrogenase
MIDKHPALIARCATESDVATAVQFASTHDLLVAVRGGAHNVAGFGTCDGGIVIDLSAMKGTQVDVRGRTVRAMGGLTWGDLDRVTQEHGLATTGGLVSGTGIAGFTLGGGIGWLMRKYGLALDNLVSVKMVTADGRRLTASGKENADLFWGVRGGGGNLGVVTEFMYRLHPVGPMVFGGAVFHPVEKARDLFRFYREWVRSLPDELTTMVAFLTGPPAPFIPQHLQGTPMIAVAMCYTGEVGQAESLVKPLRDFAPASVDLLGSVPYTALQGMFDAGAPKGILSYWKTEYIRSLDDNAINVLVEHAGKMSAPFSQVHIHHVEGAVSRVDDDSTAFGHRDEPFILNIVGMWMDSGETEQNIAWARSFAEAVHPYSTGRVYLNFLGQESEERVRAAYGERKYARLLELKKLYDPNNLFRLNQNIKPTA